MNNYMSYEMQQHEFVELKRLFDQNDQYMGPQYLSDLINNHVQQLVFAIDQTNVMGNGLCSYNGGLQLDPQVLLDIQTLQEEVASLSAMHQEGADHIPTIISTREQLVEMQDQIDGEEEVLIKTSYDRAMEILK